MTAAAPSRLTVLHVDTAPKHHRAYVRCSCSTEKWVYLQAIRAGKTKSCGCLAARRPIIEPTVPTVSEDAARFERTLADAAARAAALGHVLTPFETEQWEVAAVASCRQCDEIAAVDTSEAPGRFGRAFQRPCGGPAR